MTQILSESPVGGAGVQRHRETVERNRELGQQEQIRRLQNKWGLCRDVIDHVFEAAQSQPEEIFAQEEIYPNLPLAVTAFVCNIFGFTPKEPLVDSTVLMEALMENASSWTSGNSGSFSRSKSQDYEKVPA